MAIIKKLSKRGFTLIELMIVVVIIGILASLAIYGVQKYVASAKTGEAKMVLGRMSKDALAVYEGEQMDGAVLALGGTVGVSRKICASSATTVPAAKASIKGMKYQSKPSEWATGDENVGWTCLKTTVNTPQYFMYGYTSNVASGAPVVDASTFTVTANGDLDADEILSTFTMNGAIGVDGNNRVLVLSPAINEVNPEE